MNKKHETCNVSSDPQTTVHRQTSFFIFFIFLFFLFFLFFSFFSFFQSFLFFFFFDFLVFFIFFLFSTLSVLYHPLLDSHRKSERIENRKLFVSFFVVCSETLTYTERVRKVRKENYLFFFEFFLASCPKLRKTKEQR